jgi:hypothetical protein
MSTYRLFCLNPNDVTQAELIDCAEKERQLARVVFKRWPVAACLPYTQKDGPEVGDVVLTIWETADDAKHKRPPVAIVRTRPNPKLGFTANIWKTPVSA